MSYRFIDYLLIYLLIFVSRLGNQLKVLLHSTIHSVYLLDVLLVPTDPLERDVRSVAGHLNFTTDEVRYLTHKDYPFVYMYDQWLKRDRRNATLRKLQDVLIEIRRHDAAEIIEKAVKGLYFAN